MIQAIRSGLEVMLERDPSVCVFGEDVGYFGGVFRATVGLQQRFGSRRVFDTPLAEGGIVGVAIGMAMNGLRPVPEIQFSDYMYPAFDQITNELAKLRYRSGGEWTAPLTIRKARKATLRWTEGPLRVDDQVFDPPELASNIIIELEPDGLRVCVPAQQG